MKSRNVTSALLLAVGIACATSTIAAPGSTTPDATANARITQSQARATALSAVPGGTVQTAELEHEKGALVWSFDIQTPGSKAITEILVNAKTGRILSKQVESPADQAKEAQADKLGKH
jgi:uncharacterized membrane protein YkoI